MRHQSLPCHLTIEELQQYIQKMAVVKFNDHQKRYFTPEEIQEFEHESAQNGLQIVDLKSIIQKVTEACNKGIDEPLTIEIPANLGIKKYDTFRGQNYANIKQGYEEHEVVVCGLVNQKNETMEFFTLDGSIIEERTRPLSAKEKKDHLLKSVSGAKLMIEPGAERT
jgi:hypothetical protein